MGGQIWYRQPMPTQAHFTGPRAADGPPWTPPSLRHRHCCPFASPGPPKSVCSLFWRGRECAAATNPARAAAAAAADAAAAAAEAAKSEKELEVLRKGKGDLILLSLPPPLSVPLSLSPTHTHTHACMRMESVGYLGTSDDGVSCNKDKRRGAFVFSCHVNSTMGITEEEICFT